MELIDSGNRWLGAIPEHWALSKIGHCFKHRNEIVSDKDFEPLSVTKNGVMPQLETAAKSDNSDGRKLIRKGDFVINQRSDRKGSAGVAEQDGSCSVIYTVLEPIKYDPRYAHHLFRSVAFQEEFYRWGTGIVDDLWSTRYSLMKQIACPVPPIEEQRAIADFLDRELAQIDLLIEKQRQLVVLMRERLTAKLRQVTLAALSGMGTADLSEVAASHMPASWMFGQLGHLVSLSSGTSIDSALIEQQGTFPVFGANGFRGFTENSNLDNEVLLIGRVGALCGNVHHTAGAIWVTEHALIAKPRKPFAFSWLKHAVRAMQLGQYATSTAQPVIAAGVIAKLHLPIPSLAEQFAIGEELDAYEEHAESLIRLALQVIDSLLERRQALINSAVTGKIDVRGKN